MSKIIRFCAILISATLILSSTVSPCFAAIKEDADIVSPMYNNVAGVSVNLSKSNGKVVITITVSGKSGTTFSSGEVALLKTSGSNTGLVKSWDRLYSNTATYVFTDSSTTATSGTYKVNFSIKALRNGVGETISGSDTLTV